VGPRAVLDAVAKGKIPNPRWESNRRTPNRPAYSTRGKWNIDTYLDFVLVVRTWKGPLPLQVVFTHFIKKVKILYKRNM
jgi:hypothetical protein